MASHRTYATVNDDEDVGDGPTFTLTGRYTRHHPEHPGEPWELTFQCLAVAPPSVLASYALAAKTDGKGNTIFETPAVIQFLGGILADPEQVAAWYSLIGDRFRPVKLEVLVDVMMDVGAEVVDRPTGRASS